GLAVGALRRPAGTAECKIAMTRWFGFVDRTLVITSLRPAALTRIEREEGCDDRGRRRMVFPALGQTIAMHRADDGVLGAAEIIRDALRRPSVHIPMLPQAFPPIVGRPPYRP